MLTYFRALRNINLTDLNFWFGEKATRYDLNKLQRVYHINELYDKNSIV